MYLHYTPASALTVTVVPSNNIPAVYLDTKACAGVESTVKLLYAETGIAYFGLLMSVFSSKIVGLEMFGVLQLSYFSLANYDYVPPALMGALQRREVNGLNLGSSARDSNIPARVNANGFTASDFLSNINVMLFITAVIALVGGVMYMVTYLINKDSID
jgi:branched-subunit amino acid transport protein